MNRRPCGCCGTCGWDCAVPDPVCITIDVCGHTIIVDAPTLQFGLPAGVLSPEQCFYSGSTEVPIEDELSTIENCTYDARTETHLCALDPESASGYRKRYACVFDTHVQSRCERTVVVSYTIRFLPGTSEIRFILKVTLQARIYIHYWGTIDVYEDDSCPNAPNWTFISSTYYDGEYEISRPAGTLYAENNYDTTISVECDSIYNEYTVIAGSSITADLSGDADSIVTDDPEFACPLGTELPNLNICNPFPEYNFGTLGCGPAVAYVTLSASPCV